MITPSSVYQKVFDYLAEHNIRSFSSSFCSAQSETYYDFKTKQKRLYHVYRYVFNTVSSNYSELNKYALLHSKNTVIFSPCVDFEQYKKDSGVQHGKYSIKKTKTSTILSTALITSRVPIFITSPWSLHSDNDEHAFWIPPDFWSQLFTLRNLLLSNSCILMPITTDINSWWDEDVDPQQFTCNSARSLYIPVFEIRDSTGSRSDKPIHIENQRDTTPSGISTNKFPAALLPSVSTQEHNRFLDYREKHSTSFDLFQESLFDIIFESKDQEEALRKFSSAHGEIEDKLESFKGEMRRKSLLISTGLVCTILSLLNIGDIGRILAAVGSTSLINIIDFVCQHKKQAKYLSKDKFWFPVNFNGITWPVTRHSQTHDNTNSERPEKG